MSKRLRGLNRIRYTVMRRSVDPIGNPAIMYMRGEGMIQPTPSVQSIQVPEGDTFRLDILSELALHTRQDFPALDTVNLVGKPDDFIGDDFSPDFIVYHGVTYTSYGLNMFSRIGKYDYRKVVLTYDSGGGSVPTPNPREIVWEEIDEFEESVNKTEMALELKLAKIDLCGLYN